MWELLRYDHRVEGILWLSPLYEAPCDTPVGVLHCVAEACKGSRITLREEAVVMEPGVNVIVTSEARSRESCVQVLESLRHLAGNQRS